MTEAGGTTGDITREEFVAEYARASGLTVEDLRKAGLVAVPCDCADEGCRGWQMIHCGGSWPQMAGHGDEAADEPPDDVKALGYGGLYLEPCCCPLCEADTEVGKSPCPVPGWLDKVHLQGSEREATEGDG